MKLLWLCPRWLFEIRRLQGSLVFEGEIQMAESDPPVNKIFLKLGQRFIACSLNDREAQSPDQKWFYARFTTKRGLKLIRVFVELADGRQVQLAKRLICVYGRVNPVEIPRRGSTARPGLNLIGLFRYELGIGEAARLNATAIETLGIPQAKIEAPFLPNASPINCTFEGQYERTLLHRINVFHCNAPEMRAIRQSWPRVFRNGQYNIGYWFWELPRLHKSWLQGFNGLQEVWVSSEFVREAVARDAPIPVYNLSLPVIRPQFEAVPRSFFGLPEEKHLVLSTYDLNSYSSRKNPRGVIEAFKAAFAQNPNLHLVLKVNHAEHHMAEVESLYRQIPQGVSVIAKTLSREMLSALQMCCDSFISMHRAEGFGLNIAEYMALGKPVVATGYSGNMAFMNAENACLVDYRLLEIEITEGQYERGQLWADPSPQHAAEWLLKLSQDRGFYEQKAKAAEAYIRRYHAPEVVGEKIRARYEAILSSIQCRPSSRL